MIAYDFTAEIWVWSAETAPAAWFFVTVPADVSQGLKALRGPSRGFGSMKIKAAIGDVSWNTSVFPQKSTGCFILPVKAEVRKRAKVGPGDAVAIRLSVDI